MKKFITLFLLLSIVSANAFASVQIDLPEPEDFPEIKIEFSGVFTLVEDPNLPIHPSCAVVTNLKLDEGQIIGKVALLEEQVIGFCDLYIFPNSRHYELNVESAGCGSLKYSGSRITRDGIVGIEIIDHRGRLCRDLQPADVIVKEIYPDGREDILYSIYPRS